MRRILAAMVLAAVTAMAGCASEPSATPGELFGEYLRSTDVRNDRFPSSGESSEDRLANFASMGTPDQLAGGLLGTFECGDGSPANRAPSDACDLNSTVLRAAEDFAGAGTRPLGRSLVVKHDDGSLELLTVYVVQRADGQARLIDSTGATYTGLADFRSGNDLLGHDDTVLTLRDIVSVPGSGELVVVSGHTPPVWPWVLGGAVTVLVVAGAVLAVVRRRRDNRDTARLLSPLDPPPDSV